jgi:hypothetical protein
MRPGHANVRAQIVRLGVGQTDFRPAGNGANKADLRAYRQR